MAKALQPAASAIWCVTDLPLQQACRLNINWLGAHYQSINPSNFYGLIDD